ncbi:MAG: GNAT family N-acetyltransferase [Fimbriimonadaceae bacterium]|nr:GNAT family N-acetyltransferase [Fimbriimonadaceae bacterium]
MKADAALIRRIEQSEAENLSRCLGPAPAEYRRIAGGVAGFRGDGDFCTQTVAIGVDGAMTEADWRTLDEFYAGKCTAYEFKLSPLSDAADRRRIVLRATDITEFETILVRSLADVPALADVVIEPIPTDMYRAYMDRAAAWFFPGMDHAALGDSIYASIVASEASLFGIRDGDQWVAGAALTIANGVAWLTGGAVDPEYRRRGYHRALIAYRLREAARRGADIAAQGALAGSVSQTNAQSNGFSIAFTRTSYLLPGEPA